jgi:membrane protein YdbS with pleckstrin-like domain
LILGKTLGTYIMRSTILGGFYLYTLFIHHVIIVDILLMAIAVAFGQLVSYFVSSRLEVGRTVAILSLVMPVALGVAFVVYTFVPPRWEPFRDSLSVGYGIQ